MKNNDSGAYVAGLMKIDKSTLPSDGGERFNRLIFARSPYLLQHAENPLDWYEWGEVAFEKARSENRPILLSIGYATCHWCHVMAHESFADEKVAAILNRNYVCIKVDREERPDIDDFYMTVSQILTGSGGWPLNILMTPDKRPFFAMTYLPKHGHGGRNGFMELMENVAEFWRRHPDEIEKNCGMIMDALDNLSQDTTPEFGGLRELSEIAFGQLAKIYDAEQGGFGAGPKFPMPFNLSWLIDQGRAGNEEAMKMVVHTLRKMRFGGIWDQLGGGLHRYSVDRNWLVPHFEKMLYDQAMLAMVCLEAYQADGDRFFSAMAEDIFGFVERELTSPQGGFYSALDADSEGVEGKYYVWTKAEIEEILDTDAELFCRFFDVSSKGNFEGSSILNIPLESEAFAEREGCDPDELEMLLDECMERLLEYRSERIPPLRDEKIVTSWNGLMIAAMARGGAVSANREYTQSAARAARFILDNLRRPDGRLLRSFLNGATDIPAFLEDYAFLCLGLIELFVATLEPYWQEQALFLVEEMLRLFRDPDSGEFLKTGHDAEQMPHRASIERDDVIPSAFSAAAKCFIRLGQTCERSDLLDHAHILLHRPLQDAEQQPLSHLGSLQALAMLETEPILVTFCGDPADKELASLAAIVGRHAGQGLVIRRGEASDGVSGVQLCAAGTCYPLVSSAAELEALLKRISAEPKIG